MCVWWHVCGMCAWSVIAWTFLIAALGHKCVWHVCDARFLSSFIPLIKTHTHTHIPSKISSVLLPRATRSKRKRSKRVVTSTNSGRMCTSSSKSESLVQLPSLSSSLTAESVRVFTLAETSMGSLCLLLRSCEEKSPKWARKGNKRIEREEKEVCRDTQEEEGRTYLLMLVCSPRCLC